MVNFTPNALLLTIFFLTSGANGHGYLKSPRSRNFVAFVDGVEWGGTESTPAKEYCPHCLNRGGQLASCGIVGDHNYDQPMNALGGVMPTNIQSTYAPGSQIDVDVVLSAHHKGHFEFYACNITAGEIPTNECFQQHPLKFVEDPLYGAPKDPNYPHRAMIPPLEYRDMVRDDGGVPGSFFRHRMELPPDLEGGLVLLQWYYLTANSCKHPGYDNYPLPVEWNEDYSHLPECQVDEADGGNGTPERFWNCAEISLTMANPTVTTSAPVPAPSPPTTSSPQAWYPTNVPTSPTLGPGTCGDGNVGNGLCPDTSLCCSKWGHCGSTEAYCGNQPSPTPETLSPATEPPTPAPLTQQPVITPTKAPSTDFVISTTTRCGKSELDARCNCGKECLTQADCTGSGEWCWSVHPNYCGSRTVETCTDLSKATSDSRCGKNELEARELCGNLCSSAVDCNAGESCWSVQMNTCDCNSQAGVFLLRGSN